MHRMLPTRWGLKPLEALFVFAFVVVVCIAIQSIAPQSGLAKAIHEFWHIFAIVIGWLSGILAQLAQLLNQL